MLDLSNGVSGVSGESGESGETVKVNRTRGPHGYINNPPSKKTNKKTHTLKQKV